VEWVWKLNQKLRTTAYEQLEPIHKVRIYQNQHINLPDKV